MVTEIGKPMAARLRESLTQPDGELLILGRREKRG
jgi:hypothetical protein